MTAILINPEDKTVTEVEFDGSIDQAYDLTGCTMIQPFGMGGITLLLDEEGLLKSSGKPFKFMGHIFVGKTLMVGTRSWKTPPKWSLAEATAMVQFPNPAKSLV